MDSTPAPPPAATSARTWSFWALGIVTVLFGAVRFAAACNDLWLDEIWSLRLVQQLHSPAEIVTKLWHDNNHPLNSLWLYFVQPAKADWMYRLLSVFIGTAAVWLAGVIARRLFQQLHPDQGPGVAQAAGIVSAVLVGGSYLLVHYSSEARGYAPAVGFGFLAVFALLRGSDRPAGAWAAVYGLACVLGLLAHLVMVQVVLGGLAWSAVMMLRQGSSGRDRLVHLAGWHLGPVIFLGLYYFGFVAKVVVGGGPQLALGDVLATLATFTLGFPSGPAGLMALLVFLFAALVALVLLWCRDRAWAVFFMVAGFVAPALTMNSSRFVLLYPRYFIMSAALGLLLVGYLLARLWAAGRAGRVVTLVLLAGFLAGNGVHAARLLRDGRGQYSAALRFVAAETPTFVITVASDSDFRNFGVIDYYQSAVGLDHRLQYLPGDQPPPEGGPQWILVHRLDESTPVPGAGLEIGPWRYRLARVFPHAPLSGWEWYVFRNTDPNVLPPPGR